MIGLLRMPIDDAAETLRLARAGRLAQAADGKDYTKAVKQLEQVVD